MKKYKIIFLLSAILMLTACSDLLDVNISKNDYQQNSLTSLIVPDVSGVSFEDAEMILKLNGFEVDAVTFKEKTNFEDGLVVETNPKVGSVVVSNKVEIFVATDFIYEVENYIGENYFLTKSKLENLGLVVEVLEKNFLDNEEFIIVDQEPIIGTKMKKGDKVILYVTNLDFLNQDYLEDNGRLKK